MIQVDMLPKGEISEQTDFSFYLISKKQIETSFLYKPGL